MLRSLFALVLLAAPLALAQDAGTLIPAGSTVHVVNNEVVPADTTPAHDFSLMQLEPTPMPEPQPDPISRSSGNSLWFGAFSCSPGQQYSSLDGYTLGGTDAIHRCTDVDDRSPQSTSIELQTIAADNTIVTHTFKRSVELQTRASQVSFNFQIWRSTDSPAITKSMFDVTYQIQGGIYPEVTRLGSTPPPAAPAVNGDGATTGWSLHYAAASQGSWKSYSVFFTIDWSVVPTLPLPEKMLVDLTFKVKTKAGALNIYRLDNLEVRYHRLIANPSGDLLFQQTFMNCGNVAQSTDVEDAMNFNDLLRPWTVENYVPLRLSDPAMTCDSSQVDAPNYLLNSWSLLMSSHAIIVGAAPEDPAYTDGQLNRGIQRYIDVVLLPGKEITLEFWMKYIPVPNQQYAQYSIAQVRAAIQMDPGTSGWRTDYPAFDSTPDLLMPGPRIIDAGEGPVSYKSGDFYRYRSVFTYRGSEPLKARIEISVFRLLAAESTLDAGSYWIDEIKMWYSTFETNVFGDPAFVGLYNQHYQVHGIDGGAYNLVSSPTTQVNSRFVFLSEGNCPVFAGVPMSNCWAHPGSYLGAVAIQEIVDGVTHKLVITAGPAQDGFASVELDGVNLLINDTVAYGDTFDVTFAASHVVMVSTADFAFTFENSDMFINQGVVAQRPLSLLTCHGLFGQTHKRKVYPTKVKYIEGDVDDYLIADNDLFGTDFVYNQFHAV